MGKRTAKKRIIWIGVCVLFAALAVYLLYPEMLRVKLKKQELRSCSTSTGGGMLGGYKNADLRRDKEGNVVLTITEKATHADREVTTVYPASPEAFDKIRELVDSCKLYAASKRPYSKFQVLDGDTTSVSFSYENDSFRISDNQELSQKMAKGFREVRDYLYSLAQGEGVTTVEPQLAMLYLKSGYTLQFYVTDAFDGKLEGILDEEQDVSAFADCGIVLHELPDWGPFEEAAPEEQGAAGDIVYDPDGGQFILLYADHDFAHPVYRVASLNGYVASACPLIAEMEGSYRLYLN